MYWPIQLLESGKRGVSRRESRLDSGAITTPLAFAHLGQSMLGRARGLCGSDLTRLGKTAIQKSQLELDPGLSFCKDCSYPIKSGL